MYVIFQRSPFSINNEEKKYFRAVFEYMYTCSLHVKNNKNLLLVLNIFFLNLKNNHNELIYTSILLNKTEKKYFFSISKAIRT